MNNETETRRLIERLMSGEISPAGQRRLKTLLSAADLDEELIVYRDMMEWMDRPLPVPTDEELRGVSKMQTPHRAVRRWAVAAGIAIVLGLAGWMRMNRPATEPQGTEEVLAKKKADEEKMESYAKAQHPIREEMAKENPIRKELAKENPVRDDLFVAQGFNPGKANKGIAPSPSGEAYLKTGSVLLAKNEVTEASPKGEDVSATNGNPEINPRATNRTSLRDYEETSVRPGVQLNQTDAQPIAASRTMTSSTQYAMQTDEPLEDEILQCEFAFMEEEFQQYEAKHRTVSL